ncbi:MAG: NAD(P)/FAD-dependent oxidoreductase [Pseudomonadota bacterium]
MARTDAIVLGAGMVGVSAAVHLAKRGLAVALVDRRGPGEETSYGNAGIIEGNTYFPYPFPLKPTALLKIAFKLAPEANYHLSYLPKLAPWLFAYLRHSTAEAMLEFAAQMRPLFAASIREHQTLMRESHSERYLRTNGWLKIYRTKSAFDEARRDLDAIAAAGITFEPLDVNGSMALEPALSPVFERGVFWPQAASVSNPLAVTRAYAELFRSLGGVPLTGDARSLHKSDGRWRVDTSEGPVDAPVAVVALGPWGPDVLEPLGIRLPLEVKRGYHRHFRPDGNKGLNRPVLDAEVGYAVVPMEQGLRLTTGAEFASRDAPPTPVQFDRLMPKARALFPLGKPIEAEPWMGRRPCFPDSKPVIGPAPGQPGLWLDYGHAHWGLTLGPVSGRLLAEMITGEVPFTDPAPYSAERFAS